MAKDKIRGKQAKGITAISLIIEEPDYEQPLINAPYAKEVSVGKSTIWPPPGAVTVF